MLVIILIFVIGLTPAIISAVQSYRANHQAKSQMGCQGEVIDSRRLRTLVSGDKDLHYVEGLGYMIGDITCDLNARSPYLRCAFNPMGPCDGCREYAPKVFERQF